LTLLCRGSKCPASARTTVRRLQRDVEPTERGVARAVGGSERTRAFLVGWDSEDKREKTAAHGF